MRLENNNASLPELVQREIKIKQLDSWFVWYDNQVAQAERAQRTNTEWYAVKDDKNYRTLAELDAAANEKQSELRVLKIQHKDEHKHQGAK